MPPPRPLCLLFFIGLVGCPAGAGPAPPASDVALLPRPSHLRHLPGHARLDARWRIDAGAEDVEAVRSLNDDLTVVLGGGLRAGGNGNERSIVLARDATLDSLGPESYRLDVGPSRIRIAAATARGRFYGVQTLRQLIRGGRAGEVPCVSIEDRPRMALRGVSDDISRGQMPTLESFRSTLRRLAYYKVNTYMLYIEDAARFYTDARIGYGRAAVTPQALRLLDAEARRNHIDLVPIFETLGHQSQLLSLPGNRRYAEAARPEDLVPTPARLARRATQAVAGLFGMRDPAESLGVWSFSPTTPETRAFVGSLLDELASATSGSIHLGGDEAADVGKGVSREAVARRGYGPVVGEYLGALASDLRVRHARRVLVYGDLVLRDPRVLRELPDDVTVVDWSYFPDATFESLDSLRRVGARHVVISPGLWNWSSFHPNYSRAFTNIARFTAAGMAAGAEGSVVASWGDGGAESLHEANWPGYAFAADAAWSGEALADSTFLLAFASTEFGARSAAIAGAIHVAGWQNFEQAGWYGKAFHRALTVRPRSPAWRERMQTLAVDMRHGDSLLTAGRRAARWNPYGLEVVAHAMRRFAFIAAREGALDELATARTEEGRRHARLELARLAGQLEALTVEYRRLWLHSSRPALLAVNADRLQRQVRRLEELARNPALP